MGFEDSAIAPKVESLPLLSPSDPELILVTSGSGSAADGVSCLASAICLSRFSSVAWALASGAIPVAKSPSANGVNADASEPSAAKGATTAAVIASAVREFPAANGVNTDASDPSGA